MTDVCMLNLNEGKAKDWQDSLKHKITNKFIQDSPELQFIINSKDNFWSKFKGFFQWIMCFFQ